MSALPETVITPDPVQRFRQFLADLWRFRDLFVSFLERDVKLRYKQTVLGVAWVVIQPLMMSGAFALIFGRVAGLGSEAMPHLLFFMSAQVAWMTFAMALSQSAASLETNAGLVSKIYFPRVVVPAAYVVGTLPDFLIGFALLNAVALALGHWHWALLAVMPAALCVQLLTAGGIGMFLAAVNAQYRDVKYVIGFLIQLGMLVTPVFYGLAKSPWPDPLNWINPMAGVVSTYRWALGDPAPDAMLLVANVLAACAYAAAGLWFFRWREARLVDVL